MQSNLDDSNTKGLFTLDDSNSFLNPYESLSVAQENKYLGNCFFIIIIILSASVCCVYSLESPHRGDSNEYTQHTIIV